MDSVKCPFCEHGYLKKPIEERDDGRMIFINSSFCSHCCIEVRFEKPFREVEQQEIYHMFRSKIERAMRYCHTSRTELKSYIDLLLDELKEIKEREKKHYDKSAEWLKSRL